MSDQAIWGVARFVGAVRNDHEIFSIMYPDDLELYHVDPPLSGYRIVAAAQSMYAMHAWVLGDPDPPPPEDPVSTHVYGTTGGEGLQIEWRHELLRVDGRVPARALAEAGYRVQR